MAQQTPVQVSAFLNPPYSLALYEYGMPGSNLLQVQLLLTDLTKNQYPVKLRLIVEGVGITIKTKSTFLPQPIPLSGGTPYILTAEDLQPYFSLENLDLLGISKRDYQRLGMLPEGFYRFTIQVLDYYRSSVVSNSAMAQAWIILADPPFLNYPMKEEKLIARDPQNIQFSWSPRQQSPNLGLTEYTLQLFEILPEGSNPYNTAASTQPYFETTTYNTAYFYTLSDPMLVPGRQYAWRVKAANTEGYDRYKNDGYSEVRAFRWGDACEEMLNVTVTPFSTFVKITWEPQFGQTQFKIRWHSAKPGATVWTETTNLDFFIIKDLVPGETIAVSVAGMCGSITGLYTPEFEVTTLYVEQEVTDFECGKPTIMETLTGSPPLQQVYPGMRFTNVGGWELEVIEVESSENGVFNGTCWWTIPMFK
ncbi:MAG TPA: hypothetical protein VGA21_07650, partial [Cyclobacteriaceae bacterium]